MAGQRPVTLGFCEVTARPASMLRRICYDLFPYWQASKPKFELTVTALEGFSSPQDFLYSVEFSNGQKTVPKQLRISHIKVGDKRSYVVNEIYLVFTGDTFLIVADIHKPNDFQTVYMFHTTSRTWLALAIFAGFLAGVFATLGHWLLSVLN